MLKSVSSLLLYVEDLARSKDFYSKLGFIIHEETDKQIVVRLNWFKIQLIDQTKAEFKKDFTEIEKGAGTFTYISVEDVDDYYKDIVSKGIKPSSEPKDWEWGNREFVVKDPDGYRYVFFKAK
jgi:catechol 2,3-dioxygenase-like lactoylglutathione lyase family enzyme